MYFNQFLAFFLALRHSEALPGWEKHYVKQYMEVINEDDTMREFTAGFSETALLEGIKWCGPDEFIQDYQDLGFFTATDQCCEEHRSCPDYIEGFQTEHNLTNPVNYKRWHCDCDEQLYDCLINSADDIAAVVGLVGKIYFTNFGTQCFKLEHPIKNCVEEHYLVKVNHAGEIWRKKCLQYELDAEKPKIYQWFDLANFPNAEALEKMRNDVT